MSILEFYTATTSIWDELALTEPVGLKASNDYINYREEQRLVQFLMALCSDFEGLRGSILHRSPLSSIDSVVSELVAEETRLKSLATEMSLQHYGTSVLAISSTPNRNKGHAKVCHLRVLQVTPHHGYLTHVLLNTSSNSTLCDSLRHSPSSMFVMIADGTPLPLAGVGSIHTSNLSLIDAYCVSGLTLNLISIDRKISNSSNSIPAFNSYATSIFVLRAIFPSRPCNSQIQTITLNCIVSHQSSPLDSRHRQLLRDASLQQGNGKEKQLLLLILVLVAWSYIPLECRLLVTEFYMAERYPNFWRRSREIEYSINDYYIIENSFGRFNLLDFNTFVDTHIKEAALRVSPTLVSLVSYSGEKPIFWASGIIIECENVDGSFFSTILTSASLLRVNACENSLPQKFKVEVILPNGNLCSGDIIAYDWHFNISAIKIQSSFPLQTANLRCLDDAVQIVDTSGHFPLMERSFQLHPHSNLFKLSPGDDFIALGRYHSESYELMVAPGKFSIDRCGLDCKELHRVNCKITKCGIGGPMINLYGEVVGINFYAEDFTPFLPMNVVCKWWEHVKGRREYGRPWLGMQVTRLFAADMDELEKILQKFPEISKGLFVEEVAPESPAAFAGICPNDVILQFGGKDVQSCLELFEIIWDEVGKRVDLVVLRPSNGARLGLSMVVADISTVQFNRWPHPTEYLRPVVDRF